MQSATSIMPPGPPALYVLANSWWILLLRGLTAILFGTLALTWPGLTLFILILLYGAYALVDGLLALIAAFAGGPKPVSSWWLFVIGIVGIVAAVVTFMWPGLTAILLVLVMGTWSLLHGIFEIIGAIQLRREIDNEWMLFLSGVLSVLFGLLVLFKPAAGALALVWVIATYAIVLGVMFVALALRLRRLRITVEQT